MSLLKPFLGHILTGFGSGMLCKGRFGLPYIIVNQHFQKRLTGLFLPIPNLPIIFLMCRFPYIIYITIYISISYRIFRKGFGCSEFNWKNWKWKIGLLPNELEQDVHLVEFNPHTQIDVSCLPYPVEGIVSTNFPKAVQDINDLVQAFLRQPNSASGQFKFS